MPEWSPGHGLSRPAPLLVLAAVAVRPGDHVAGPALLGRPRSVLVDRHPDGAAHVDVETADPGCRMQLARTGDPGAEAEQRGPDDHRLSKRVHVRFLSIDRKNDGSGGDRRNGSSGNAPPPVSGCGVDCRKFEVWFAPMTVPDQDVRTVRRVGPGDVDAPSGGVAELTARIRPLLVDAAMTVPADEVRADRGIPAFDIETQAVGVLHGLAFHALFLAVDAAALCGGHVGPALRADGLEAGAETRQEAVAGPGCDIAPAAGRDDLHVAAARSPLDEARTARGRFAGQEGGIGAGRGAGDLAGLDYEPPALDPGRDGPLPDAVDIVFFRVDGCGAGLGIPARPALDDFARLDMGGRHAHGHLLARWRRSRHRCPR